MKTPDLGLRSSSPSLQHLLPRRSLGRRRLILTAAAQLCRLYAGYHAAKTLDLGLGSSSPSLQRLLPHTCLSCFSGRARPIASASTQLRCQCAVLRTQLRHASL